MQKDFARGTNGLRFEIPPLLRDETETTYTPSGSSLAISSCHAASTPASSGSSSRLSINRAASYPRSWLESSSAFDNNSETRGVICATIHLAKAQVYTWTIVVSAIARSASASTAASASP
jgi:hypothetical protein